MMTSQKIAVVTDPPYNAKGDGITDDTDAIQQAILENAMVYLPAGTYLVTDGSAFNLTALAVPSGRSIRGAGPGVTIIKLADGGNAHIFSLENATDITISDMTIDGNRTAQILSVHAVRVLGSSRVWLQRLHILNPRHYGIGIDASALNSAEDIFIDSVRVEGSGGDSINQHNNVIGKKVQRIMMSNITVINPVTVDASGAGLDVRGIVTLSNIHVADVAAGRWAISLRNTYVSEAEIGARRSTLTNFSLEGAPGNGSMGLRIVAGEVGISNGFIQGFDYGVAVLGALPVETFLPTARVGLSNVIATKSGRKGFFFGVAAKEISCVNCWAYENLNDGVEIQADQVSWIGGGMTDNGGRGLVVKSQLLAAGSRLQLLGIQGVRMANSGTATIAGGSTAVVVPHGLWFTPEAQQIQVVPTNNEATSFWVSDVTAASFTINVAADPGETTATYAWRATWQ